MISELNNFYKQHRSNDDIYNVRQLGAERKVKD